MNIYKVGIMSDVAYVLAPSPAAAALFYGLHTGGNMKLGAAVYECNGEEIEESLPWGKFMFGDQTDDALFAEFESELKRIKWEIEVCKFADGYPTESEAK